MPQTTPKISRRRAERQEAVFAKLQDLTRRVSVRAARAPGLVVPEALRVEAEALLFEAETFRPGRRESLPLAAPHFSGLAAQLGEALAMLVAFELRHTRWNAAIAETMWLVEGPMMRPRRLQPRPGSKAAAREAARARQEAELRAGSMVELRAKLVRRLEQFYSRDPASG